MCAILDASAVGEVLGGERTAPGRQFFEWLETSRARLVVGGKLYDELASHAAFRKWAATAIVDGRVRREHPDRVERSADALAGNSSLRSNDPHVIALAEVGGARLLYSYDTNLRHDFRDPALLSKPRGKLYPTGKSPNDQRRRRRLLDATDLCPNRG